MNEKNSYKLTEDEIIIIIENELKKLIEASIEGEYIMDKFNNMVYKQGGRQRAIEDMKFFVEKFSKEYKYPKSKIISTLKKIFDGISESCKAEGKEIVNILDEIKSEDGKKDSKKEIEHEEVNILE